MSEPNKIHIEWEPRKGELIAAVICLFIVFLMVTFAIVAYTPLHNFIPGYPDREARDEMALNKAKMDSLEHCMYRWELYSRNLKEVIAGGVPITIDSILRAAGSREEDSPAASSRTDSLLRDKVSSQRGQKETRAAGGKTSLEGKHFFTPIKGTVLGAFDESLHPYLDISAPAGSSVMSVMDGTVIFKEWNDLIGWTAIVQHDGGILSVYKNLGNVLRNVSDKITAGTAIGVLGRDKDRDDPDSKDIVMRFELWNNGVCENPSPLITF